MKRMRPEPRPYPLRALSGLRRRSLRRGSTDGRGALSSPLQSLLHEVSQHRICSNRLLSSAAPAKAADCCGGAKALIRLIHDLKEMP
jgi:hypothetical protein